jgi:acetyl-CoA acetyltransferase
LTNPIAYLPYGCWWSTPFARWQGPLAAFHSLRYAAFVARRALAARRVDMAELDFGVLGMTVPQRGSFYGLPWLAAEMGAAHLPGPTIMQACATSARSLQVAASEVANGSSAAALVVAADRVSNGPMLLYPQPGAPGGAADVETWVLDNFSRDPWAGCAMVQTAENVAAKWRITREAQDELVLMRLAQYHAALGTGFHAPFLVGDLPDPSYSAMAETLAGDFGVQAANPEKLRALRPVQPGGTVTYAGQTHPADGNAGALVANRETARRLATRPEIEVLLHGFGTARVEAAMMPAAPVPASARALAQAGTDMAQIDAVTSHNPFAVNDLVFAVETGFPLERMNVNGCSLVFGHPQGPTGLRCVIELVETLAARGGGRGLFQGCAAGDTAMALVLEVRDAST